MLPEQLRQYVGPVGVWGDVNDILLENLQSMKVLGNPSAPSELISYHCLTMLFSSRHCGEIKNESLCGNTSRRCTVLAPHRQQEACHRQ